MNGERIYTMLGFAQKAGKLVSGENTVEAEVKNKKACLLVVAEDAPERTKERMKNMSVKYHTGYMLFGEKNGLGQAIGKSPRNVILILDKNFAAQINK